MGCQLDRAQSCPCLRCCEGRSTSPLTRVQQEPKARSVVPKARHRQGLLPPPGLQLRQRPDARASAQKHLPRKSWGAPTEVPSLENLPSWPRHLLPASLEHRAKLLGAGGVLWPCHQPEPTAVLHHHQQKNAHYKYGKWMHCCRKTPSKHQPYFNLVT